MPLSRRQVLQSAAATAAVTVLPARGWAQEDFPSKPITLVVPIAAGGALDIFARAIANFLTTDLRQQVVVENRVGAGGTLGLQYVARARPDGYTLGVVSNSTFAIAPHLYQLPYDPDKDFTPIAMLTDSPSFMCVHKSVPVNNMAEFLAYTRANPGKVAFASAGVGFTSHLAAELFMSLAKVDMLHVPYRGGALASQAVIANECQVNFAETPSAVPMWQSGNVKAIGVTTRVRSPFFPDIPTIAEAGVPGYHSSTSMAVMGPAGIPKPVADKITAAILKYMRSPGVEEQIKVSGLMNIAGDGAAYERHRKENTELWGNIIRTRNIKLPT